MTGVLNSLRQVLRDLRSQKLRSFLTGFGIVWGTVSVSLLLAFGEGLHAQTYKNQAGIGENIAIIWPSMTSLPYEGLGKGRPIRVTQEDVDALRAETPHLLDISSEFRRSMKLVYGSRTLSVDVAGVEPGYGAMRAVIPAAGGRFLNVLDEDRRRRVAFVGDKLAADIFDGGRTVGERLLLGGAPFLVVGTLQPKQQNSNYSGRDENKVFIPASTFRALTGTEEVSNVIAKATSAAHAGPLVDGIRELLARRHRFDPADEEALMVWDTTEGFQMLDRFFVAFRLFLGVVGSLTLVVGGIGVSNIMNVVVEERTREIGIKMALGARPRSVLRQLMAETMIVTAVAGLAGGLIAAGLCAVFPSFGLTEFIGDPELSPQVVALTAGLLAVIALAAAWFPARDAARLDPVVAMKME
jgi:putative ABC transport system permease protein